MIGAAITLCVSFLIAVLAAHATERRTTTRSTEATDELRLRPLQRAAVGDAGDGSELRPGVRSLSDGGAKRMQWLTRILIRLAEWILAKQPRSLAAEELPVVQAATDEWQKIAANYERRFNDLETQVRQCRQEHDLDQVQKRGMRRQINRLKARVAQLEDELKQLREES